MTTNWTNWSDILKGKNFIPWAYDASGLLSGNTAGGHPNRDWIRDLFLVSTAGLESFERGRPVVTSPRGHGKSLILAKQAVKLLIAKDEKYTTLFEGTPFVNELAQRSITVPIAHVKALEQSDRWRLLWKCALMAHVACMVVRQRRIPDINNEATLKSAFGAMSEPSRAEQALSYFQFASQVWDESKGHVESIAPAMAKLIEKGTEAELLHEWIGKFRKAYLQSAENIRCALFIDAVDEALGTEDGLDLMKTDQTRDADYQSEQVQRIWLSAQKGLLMAIREMRGDYPHVQIYATMRVEAIRSINKRELDQLGGQRIKAEGSLYTELNYTASELRQIFAANVAAMYANDNKSLVEFSAADPVHSLFGFSKVVHRQVYGADEKFFDLMQRHTFGSPRELVRIAKTAIDCATKEARASSLDKILSSVDTAAVDICNDWLARVTPIFGGIEELEEFKGSEFSAQASDVLNASLAQAAVKITHNVIAKVDIDRVEAVCGRIYLFDALFARGLVGYPRQAQDTGDWQLYFRPPNGIEEALPASYPYVALHPAFSAWIRSFQRRLNGEDLSSPDFYSNRFIVGEGYPCPPCLNSPWLVLDLTKERQWILSLSSDLLPLIPPLSSGSKIDMTSAFQVNLHDATEFMPGATDKRRDEARILLVSLLLAKSRQAIHKEIGQEKMHAEIPHLLAAGVLPDETASAEIFKKLVAQCVAASTRDALINELNKSLENTELALQFHPKTLGANGLMETEGYLRLQTRAGHGRAHARWADIDPKHVVCRVKQARRAS